jgi:hypothetical protein
MNAKKRHKIKKQRGGIPDVKLTEGPFDTTNHTFMEEPDIIQHINEMKTRKIKLDKQFIEADENQKLDIEKENIELQQAAVAKEKEKDRKKAEEIAKQTRASQLNIQTMLTMGAIIAWFNKLIQNIIEFFSGRLSWSADRVGYVSTFLKDLVTSLIQGAYAIVKGCFGIVDRVFNGNAMKSLLFTFFKALFSTLFALLFFLVILALIIYGASLFTKKTAKPGATTAGSSQECSSILEDGVTININNFGKLFEGPTISKSVPTFNTSPILFRPKFDSIPTANISSNNPFQTLNNWLSKWFNKAVNSNPVLSRGINNIKYIANVTSEGVSYVSGGEPEILMNRTTLVGGRSDNIINVDANIFTNKTMLRKKKINTVGNVVSMGRPKEIEWTLPVTEYNDSDLNKLPPTILKAVNAEKKKTVVIPWIMKNNNYVLSCSDAYFKEIPTEKANILIDTVDGNSCTVNIDDKPETFRETKQRYVDSSDLSVFFSS